MYTGINHLHSSFRYLVLLVLVISVIISMVGYFQKKPFEKTHKMFALMTLILAHLQLLIGIVMFFISPIVDAALGDMGTAMKEPALRFYTVEHTSAMLFSIILITIGYSRSKKSYSDTAKHGYLAAFYGIALVLIFAMIPWPFLRDFGTWI